MHHIGFSNDEAGAMVWYQGLMFDVITQLYLGFDLENF